MYLLTSFPETIEIVRMRCISHVVRDVHLVVLDMCISCSMERDNSFHKVNAARKSKVDDNTARMQSIKQLGV